MPTTIPLAQYLFTRLAQQGVHALHGVPGDFTLRALDYVRPAGLRWIGNCNELNAGYAADGYARVRGLGGLFTTFGVGELSALNAVAGSYSEHVPIVHIVGTPARALQDTVGGEVVGTAWRHRIVHHMVSNGPGSTDVYAQAARNFAVASVDLKDSLRPGEAEESVDWAIGQALAQSRPVYIQLPSDMAAVEVDAERLQSPLNERHTAVPRGTDGDTERWTKILLERLKAAKQPLLLVDRGHGIPFMKDLVNDLVRKSGIPTLALPSGAGMIDTALPNYYGVHSGPVGRVDTMPYVESCDLVLAFGPLFSDTQTLGWKVVPDHSKMIVVGRNAIEDEAVDSERVLTRLLQQIEPSDSWNRNASLLGDFRTVENQKLDASDPIDQTRLYLQLQRFIQPDDLVILGNATPVIGGRDILLPPRSRVIASGTWFSIGHMLPATQGASVALEGRRGRAVLIDGDGNVQMTVQELSTIIRERLPAVVFILNNGGYAYERQIHGLHEEYNDLAPWRYLEAASFFGAPSNDPGYPVQMHRVETWGDLDKVYESNDFHDGKGLKMVEILVDKYDVPEKFREVFRAAGRQL